MMTLQLVEWYRRVKTSSIWTDNTNANDEGWRENVCVLFVARASPGAVVMAHVDETNGGQCPHGKETQHDKGMMIGLVQLPK